jgi:hypothetical protein
VAPSTIAAMVTAQACRALADYWSALRPPGGLPRRAQVDPGAIPLLLPSLYILGVTDAGVIIRLAGTALRQLYGIEMTGRNMLDGVAPEHRAARLWRTLHAADHPCGMYLLRSHRYASGATDNVESIFLPLIVKEPADALRAQQFIGIAASKSDRRWIAGEERGALMTPHVFRFLDVGFGTPPTIHPPAESAEA